MSAVVLLRDAHGVECGGEYGTWKNDLSDLAVRSAKKAAENHLRIEIDEEAFERPYGLESHPFGVRDGQRIAVRVVSRFGEESRGVMGV